MSDMYPAIWLKWLFAVAFKAYLYIFSLTGEKDMGQQLKINAKLKIETIYNYNFMS